MSKYASTNDKNGLDLDLQLVLVVPMLLVLEGGRHLAGGLGERLQGEGGGLQARKVEASKKYHSLDSLKKESGL